jgi:hypothetical protein
VTREDVRSAGPRIDRYFHPGRHRSSAYEAVLSYEINNAPAAVALLDVCECERRHFGSP